MAKKATKRTSTKASTKKASTKRTTKRGSARKKKGAQPAAVENLDDYLANLDSAWTDSRQTVAEGGDFSPADVPDGEYIIRLSGGNFSTYKSGTKKGMPRVAFRYDIISPADYAGEILRSMDDLSDRAAGNKTAMDWLLDRLRRLGIDVKELGIREIPEAVTTLVKNAGYYRAAVENRYVDSKRTPGTQEHYQSVYINDGPLDDDELAEHGVTPTE